MSFAMEYKREILHNQLPTKSERLAFLAAVFRMCGSYHISKYSQNLELETEFDELCNACVRYLTQDYGACAEIEIKTGAAKQFLLKIAADHTFSLGQKLGMIEGVDGKITNFCQGMGIYLKTKEEMIAYIIGIVVAAATITVPQDQGDERYVGGYHFELDFCDEQLATDVMQVMAQLDIFTKKTQRLDNSVIYIKESGMLFDLMMLTGSRVQSKRLMDIMYSRSIRSNVNRQQNCTFANMDKAITASQNQIDAIEAIASTLGLENLPIKLKEVAQVRLSNPEYTLDQIVDELGGEITKSGVNHRFRKIIEMASAIDNKGRGE